MTVSLFSVHVYLWVGRWVLADSVYVHVPVGGEVGEMGVNLFSMYVYLWVGLGRWVLACSVCMSVYLWVGRWVMGEIFLPIMILICYGSVFYSVFQVHTQLYNLHKISYNYIQCTKLEGKKKCAYNASKALKDFK